MSQNLSLVWCQTPTNSFQAEFQKCRGITETNYAVVRVQTTFCQKCCFRGSRYILFFAHMLRRSCNKPSHCDKNMCGTMATSCGMTRTLHCAPHLRAPAGHMNNRNAHTTIHSPCSIAGVRSSTIYTCVKIDDYIYIYVIIHMHI